MSYKLTIEQASILNITKGLMESYRGTNFFKDISESMKKIIRDEYFKYYGKENGNTIIKKLSSRYGVSISYIKSAIYETYHNR